MIQTSADFENVISRETRTFLARMVFDTFTLSEEIRQITIHMGNADGEAFIDGAAYSSHVDISMNITNTDIAGQEFLLEIGLLLDDETVEYVPIGVYKASAADITKTKYTMTVTAWDRLGEYGNSIYTPAVIYPCTAGDILDDITQQTGLVFNTSAFPSIRGESGLSFPESYSISDVIGFIAGLKGGFAYVDGNGTVVMARYPTTSSLTVPAARCLDEITLADSLFTVDAGGDVTEYSYYPGIVRFLGDPRLELTDMIAVVDTREVVRNVPCIGIKMTFDGGLVTVVSAPAQTTSDREFGPVQKRINTALLAAENAQEVASEALETAEEAGQTASNAVIAANGKTKIFYQNDAPTEGMAIGDMWFDIDGGNAVYQYTSSGWVLRQYGQGALAANSVTAVEINVASLSAIAANIGTVTAGKLQSSDYSYTSGTYTTAGMIVDLDNKVIRTPKTAILSDGSIYSSSVNLEGKITATSGDIGPWTISSSAIYNGKTALEYGNGSGVYIGSDGIGTSDGSYGNLSLSANGTLTLKNISADRNYAKIIIQGGPGSETNPSKLEIGYTGLYAKNKTYSFSQLDLGQNNVTGGYLDVTGFRMNTGIHLRGDNYGVGYPVISLLAHGDTSSSTATNGGLIEFCFNSNSATAKIQETSSGVLTVTGSLAVTSNLTVSGTLTGHASLDLPLTGGTVSGSIAISATGKGFNLTDSSGTTYGGIYDNGDNLWIGAAFSTAPHHRGSSGNTYISTGYSTTNSAGNSTIYLSVPSLSGTTWSQTAYGVLHTGNYSSYALPLSGGTLSGNLTFSTKTDNGIIQGYNSTTKYTILRNHGNGNVSISACGAGMYVGYTNSTFVNFLNGKMSLNSQGSLTIVGQLSTGGKGTGTDGKAGTILSSTGNLYLQHTSGSNIYFFYGTSTSSTSRLYESASGTLTASANFNITGNLAVTTTSTSVDRTVTVANGNASGSVRAASGGAFGLYVTKTGGTARTAVYLTAMDSNGTYRTNWNPSDRRVKNIIGDMPDSEAETLLRRLKIYNFRYKTDATKTVQNGMIAQQVRDVLSECGYGYRLYLDIRSADGEDFLYNLITPEQDVQYGIDYARMTPILWKGWQLHDGKILNHEDRIATLERENNRLKKEIELLKGDVA